MKDLSEQGLGTWSSVLCFAAVLRVRLLTLTKLLVIPSPAGADGPLQRGETGKVNTTDSTRYGGLRPFLLVFVGALAVILFSPGDSPAPTAVCISPYVTLSGYVTDVNSGDPIMNARVKTASGLSGSTDSTGFYSFCTDSYACWVGGSPGFNCQDLELSACHHNTVNQTISWRTRSAPGQRSFTLSPNFRIWGYITDAHTGSPIANATVWTEQYPAPAVTTNAGGYFSFYALPCVDIWASHPDYGTGTTQTNPGPDPGGGSNSTPLCSESACYSSGGDLLPSSTDARRDLSLFRTYTVWGYVNSGTYGVGIAGVTLQSDTGASTTTNASGYYSLVVPGDSTTLTASMPLINGYGYQSVMKTLPAPGSVSGSYKMSTFILNPICPATATPGDEPYCTYCGPCGVGKGDCDANYECGGLFCKNDVGAKFGYAATVDVCIDPLTTCLLNPWDPGYCADPICGPCGEGQGPCGSDGECASGLVCTTSAVDALNVCRKACALSPGDWDYCKVCGPCWEGEGDCDSDAECQPSQIVGKRLTPGGPYLASNLGCGDHNGERYGLPAYVDTCRVGAGWSSPCEVFGTVKDSFTGAVIPNASIGLYQGGQVIVSTKSVANGYYIFPEEVQGNITIKAAANGYVTSSTDTVFDCQSSVLEMNFDLNATYCQRTLGSSGYCGDPLCAPNGCGNGEGLCSSSAECQTGLECTGNICRLPAPASCELNPGDPGYCADPLCAPNGCGEGEGLCSSSAECQSGLECTGNICRLPAPAFCELNLGDPGYCGDSLCGNSSCQEGEGGCTSSADCTSGLVCTEHAGSSYGFAPGVGVCEQPVSEFPKADNTCFPSFAADLALHIPVLDFWGALLSLDLAYRQNGPDDRVWFELTGATPASRTDCSNPCVLTFDMERWVLRLPLVSVGAYDYWLVLEYVPTGDGRFWFAVADAGLLSHKVFVTSVQGPGSLGSWADAGGQTGIRAGDAICQSRANAAGLLGTFVGWLSDDSDDAYCRVQQRSGKKTSNCGESVLPADAGPWVMTDGFPFSPSIDQLVGQGIVFAPVTTDEFGVSSPQHWYRTGTNAEGVLDAQYAPPCTNWTSAAEEAVAGSVSTFSGSYWTRGASSNCMGSAALLCFESGSGPPLPPFAFPGKKAFVTSVVGPGNLASWPDAGGNTGLAAGDAICQAQAQGAGLELPERFKAWLSDNGTHAIDRLTSDGPWVRVDGVRLARNKTDLVDGTLRTTLSVTAAGVHWQGDYAWTGTQQNGQRSSSTCGDWKSAEGNVQGVNGRVFDAQAWSRSGSLGCNVSASIYCFED